MPTIEAKDCTVISNEVRNLLRASKKYPKQYILSSITIHFPRIKSKFETTKKCLHPATEVFRPEKGGVHTISLFFLDFRDLLFDLYIIPKQNNHTEKSINLTRVELRDHYKKRGRIRKAKRVGKHKKQKRMKWYLQVLRNYTNFSGRSRRTEYWMFALFNCLFLFLASILDKILGTNFDTIFGIHLKVESQPISLHILPLGYIYLIYALVVIIPSLSVSVRRLHDVGKSGWMLLIGLIPILGAIYLFILLVTDSNLAPNQYGENPKGLVVI